MRSIWWQNVLANFFHGLLLSAITWLILSLLAEAIGGAKKVISHISAMYGKFCPKQLFSSLYKIFESAGARANASALFLFFKSLPSPRFELGSPPSEGGILSIELRGHYAWL